MEIKDRIEIAKRQLKAAEQAKTVAETQLETATKQCDEIIAKMKDYNVAPDTIQAEIDRLGIEVNAELTAIENAIPQV